MLINTHIILLCLSTLNIIKTAFGNYCNSSSSTPFQSAYNVGRYVYLGQGSTNFWELDSYSKSLSDIKYDQKAVFGKDSFNWVDTAISFDFEECDRSKQSATYCDVIEKAKSLVIGVGRRSVTVGDERKYGYITYRLSDGKSLTPITGSNEEILWDLKSSGSLSDDFWPPLKEEELYYESGVFVRSRNQLLLALYDGFSGHLMSRKFEANGQWADGWTEVAKVNFKGMFEIDGRVFGFDKRNDSIFEFIWIDDQKVEFRRIANMKELLNCFGNSSIIGTNEGITHSMSTSSSTSNTPSTASTTSSTTSTTFTTISTTSVTTITSVTTSKALPNPNDTYYEIEIPVNDTTIGVTTPPEESKGTTLSEVVFIENSNNPQNTTLKDMLHKLNQKPKEPKELTPFYVFAIILIFIVIVILIVIIIRRKTMTRIVYLNSRSEDLKSAEIPLNNNNKNSNSKDV